MEFGNILWVGRKINCSQDFKKMEDLVLKVYENWNARISTALLNDWLRKVKQIADNDYKNVLIKKVLIKIR